MDYDDYESLSEDFKIVNSNQNSQFFTSNELDRTELTLQKSDVDFKEMAGDGTKNPSRRRTQRDHKSSPSQSSLQEYNVCPICSNPAVSVCSCKNRDSMCKNSHKWHTMNNQITIGHTHK